MSTAIKDRKTGTDIETTATLNTTPAVVAALTQIIVVFYYIRNNVTTKFSFHALVPADSELAAEALLEGRTVRQLTVNGVDLEMVIPKEDTENLVLNDNEQLRVFAELSYFDSVGKKFKNADHAVGDPNAFNLIQSIVRDLI